MTFEQGQELFEELATMREKLRLADKRAEDMEALANERGSRLSIAEAILRDRLELDWCHACEDYTATDYATVQRASMDGPEDVVYFCDDCGKRRENQ